MTSAIFGDAPFNLFGACLIVDALRAAGEGVGETWMHAPGAVCPEHGSGQYDRQSLIESFQRTLRFLTSHPEVMAVAETVAQTRDGVTFHEGPVMRHDRAIGNVRRVLHALRASNRETALVDVVDLVGGCERCEAINGWIHVSLSDLRGIGAVDREGGPL